MSTEEYYASVCCLQEGSLKTYETTNALRKHAKKAHGKEAIFSPGSGGAPSAAKKDKAEEWFKTLRDSHLAQKHIAKERAAALADLAAKAAKSAKSSGKKRRRVFHTPPPGDESDETPQAKKKTKGQTKSKTAPGAAPKPSETKVQDPEEVPEEVPKGFFRSDGNYTFPSMDDFGDSDVESVRSPPTIFSISSDLSDEDEEEEEEQRAPSNEEEEEEQEQRAPFEEEEEQEQRAPSSWEPPYAKPIHDLCYAPEMASRPGVGNPKLMKHLTDAWGYPQPCWRCKRSSDDLYCDFTFENCVNWGQIFRMDLNTPRYLPLSRYYDQPTFEKVRHGKKAFF